MSLWQRTGYQRRYGITQHHWNDIGHVAAGRRRVIIVRGGKAASLPWIERNFPAKPLWASNTKIDPDVGLLIVRQSNTELKEVFRHGHYVLERLGHTARSGLKELVAVRYDRGKPIVYKGRDYNYRQTPWAREGMIIEASTGRGFTSDYDLGAVIDRSERSFGKTFLSLVSTGSWTSPDTEEVLRALNTKLSGGIYRNPDTLMPEPEFPRFVHAAQAQKGGSPANKDNEHLLAFIGLGEVRSMYAMKREDARAGLFELLREFTPKVESSESADVVPLYDADGRVLRP